jgi:hypothetical protein
MKTTIYLAGFLIFTLFVFSCGDDSEKNELTREDYKKSIKQMEDSIATIQKDPVAAAKMPSLTNIELINRLVAYYHAFPKDEYAADCLFKVHMKYGELQAHQNAVAYGDTLLQSYPNYKNRDFLLESLGSSYDVYINEQYYGNNITKIQINSGDILRVNIIKAFQNQTSNINFVATLI